MKTFIRFVVLAVCGTLQAQTIGVFKSTATATKNQITEDLVFPSARSLTVNGVLTGTPASGTLSLVNLTLTLPATVTGGATSLVRQDGIYANPDWLTSLTADKLSLGTVPLARLAGITTAQLSATAGILNAQLANTTVTVGTTTITLGGSSLTLGGLTTVTSASFVGALTGNASTATVLATTRAINGVNFDGSAPITITAAAGTLTGTTLNSTVTASSLTSAAGGVFGSAAFTATSAYATAAQGTTADAAMPRAGGTFTGNITFTDNLYDIGAVAATRPRTGYFGTSVIAPSFVGGLTGNSSTATALATARAINGVNFDGTAPITVTAAAGTLTGSTLNNGVTASSLTSLGTIASLTATAATINGYVVTVSGTTTLNNWFDQSVKTTATPTFSTVTATTFTGALTGNASTATALATARTINGVNFDGSANIGQDLRTSASPTFVGATFSGALSGITTLSASGVITSTLATGTAPFTVASTTVVANLNASLLLGATWAAPGTIGGGTAGAANFTTIGASGQISSTNAGALNYTLRNSSGGTNEMAMRLSNTSGDLLLGVESSAGGQWVVGSAAYSSFIGTSTNKSFHLFTSDVVRMTIDSAGAISMTNGLAVTGTTTSTNCFIYNSTSNTLGAAYRANFDGSSGVSVGASFCDSSNTSGVTFLDLRNGTGGQIGSITRVTTTNAVTYNTTSDGRLKNVQREFTATEAAKLIDALAVDLFDWKPTDVDSKTGLRKFKSQRHRDDSTGIPGFVAQKEAAADPMFAHIGAVTIGDNDPTTITKQWQRSDMALIPIIWADARGTHAHFASLDSRVAALEAKVK